VKKKDWETYDTGAAAPQANSTPTPANGDGATPDPKTNPNVLFDIDAIRAEIEATSREVHLPKEMEKLKLDQKSPSMLAPDSAGLRHTKRFDDCPFEKKDSFSRRYGSDANDDQNRGRVITEHASQPDASKGCSTPGGAGYGAYGGGGGGGGNVWADYDEYDEGEGEMQMTFA